MKKFKILTGVKDIDGDIINLDGVRFDLKLFVTKNFHRQKPITLADLKREDGCIKASANIPDELLDKYPAVGYRVLKSHMEGESRVVDEMKLYEVSLCDSPNADPTIKTIREQLGMSK